MSGDYFRLWTRPTDEWHRCHDWHQVGRIWFLISDGSACSLACWGFLTVILGVHSLNYPSSSSVIILSPIHHLSPTASGHLPILIHYFLDASSHLYVRVCPYVRPSVNIKEKTPKSPKLIRKWITFKISIYSTSSSSHPPPPLIHHLLSSTTCSHPPPLFRCAVAPL